MQVNGNQDGEDINPFLQGPARRAVMASGSECSRDKEGVYRFTLFVHDGTNARVEGVNIDPVEAALEAFRLRKETRAIAKQGMI
jgi:hypothetical protein